jgi:hypothetical protein
MFPIRTKNRKAISAVLTTIIILVASIVLGTGVVVFSTNLFQTGGQSQSVQVQGVKTWVNGTWTGTGSSGGPAGQTIGWGAFVIKNTGDKILSVSSVQVRGTSVPFTSWYADTDTTRVGQNFQAQFNYTKNDQNGNIKGSFATGAGVVTPGGNPSTGCTSGTSSQQTSNPPTMLVIQETPFSQNLSPLCLGQQSGPVSLNPGSAAVIYYKLPGNLITPTDAGVTGTVSILAGSSPIAQTVRIANP